MKTSNKVLVIYLVIATVISMFACSCQSQTEQRREAFQKECDSLQELSIQDCRDSANAYADQLMEQGYGSDWAYHKSYVEFGLEPMDDEYRAIEED